MAETPEEPYERSKDALRTPPIGEWETWPECWACGTAAGELRRENLEAVAKALG